MEVDRHGQREADLDGGGDHGEIEGVDRQARQSSERVRTPGPRNGRVIAQRLGQQPQFQAELSAAGRQARIAASIR